MEQLEAGRRVLFDILKEWASASFHRQVRDTSPPGCSWQSFAMALQDAKQKGESGAKELLQEERSIRRLLIQTYRSLSKEQLESVAEAKLQCELSMFHRTGYGEVELVLKHWKWYLYCLTFDSQCFTTKKDCWNHIPETCLRGAFVVRVPLDSVDLFILSQLLGVQILLSQMFAPALHFGSHGVTLHLVTNGGMWSPLLSSKLWLQDKADLCGSVVEIGNLKGPLAQMTGKSACVLRYDVENDCHVAANVCLFPLKSVQISRIIAREEDLGTEMGRSQRRYQCTGSAFHGIADGSVDFQILLHLVRLDVGKRLDDLHEEMAGRCPRRQETWQDSLRPSKPGLCASALPLQEVLSLLSEGAQIWTKCLAAVAPRLNRPEMLACRVQEFICLEAFEHGEPVMFLAHSSSNRQAKQISSDIVCSWLVLESYLPDRTHPRYHQLLELREGDTVLVTERHRWPGWAFGQLQETRTAERKTSEGLFPLAFLRAFVWIAKIERKK